MLHHNRTNLELAIRQAALKLLGETFHDLAIEKGWWGEGTSTVTDPDTGLTRIDPEMAPPRNFPELLALAHSEISEILDEWRHGHGFTEIYFKEPIERAGTPEVAVAWGWKPEGIPIEFADLLIRVLETCAALGIDIEQAIRLKHEYNSGRPYRHGGLRA